MGVDIFFVLSGYLIGRQVLAPLARGEPMRFAAFYARRAWRILPAFVAVLAIYVAFPALGEGSGLPPWWQFATFTHNLVVDYTNFSTFSHAWSLCVEEHFYLAFPLLAWALVRWSSARRVAAIVALLVVGGVLLRGAIWWDHAAAGIERNWFVEEIYYPTWCRLDGLLAGVVLAAVAVFRPVRWTAMQVHADRFALAGIAGLALSFWLFADRPGALANTLGWPVLSAAIACLVVAASNPASVLSRQHVPGAAWIATISYSLYLGHKLVLHAVDASLGEWLQDRGLLAFAVYAVAIVAGGAVLHYAVERPGLRWRDRRRREATPAGNEAAPVAGAVETA
jgi:peptidoglycan/LPS O-acetylase OafA/YrhL